MAQEPTNLVLEHLRTMPARIAALDARIAALDDKISAMSQRSDALETEVRGVNYVATVSIGSVLADTKDRKERVSRLEAGTAH